MSRLAIAAELEAVTIMQRWLVEKGWLARATWSTIPRPEIVSSRRTLRADEVGRFLRAADRLAADPTLDGAHPDRRLSDWRTWPAAAWLLMHGLRTSEAQHLLVRDLDLVTGHVHVDFVLTYSMAVGIVHSSAAGNGPRAERAGKPRSNTMTGNEIVENFSSAYTVTVGGAEYLIYRDGRYTHAVLAVDVERVAEAELADYTAWCDRVPAVADRATALAIMAEAGIRLLHLGDGCCTAVQPAPEADEDEG